MNIEKINKLYENMTELEEIFNEEPDAVACIMGLRMASSEFRSAFFKVREILLECKVSASVNNNRRPSPSEKKEEESEGITEYHKDGTRVDIPKASKVEKTKPVKKLIKTKLDKPYETITIPGIQGRVIICENDKKKEDPLTDKFDEFILDSYNEGRLGLTPIDDVIRMFSLYADIKLNNQLYTKFRKYLCNIYNAPNGGKIHLEAKSDDLPNEDKLDDSGMTFYRHPKYTYLWCREDGTFFYLLPDGKTIKENPIIKKPRALYLSVIGGKSNHSARLLALECYMHREVNGHHVSVLNGNKNDLSYANLSISTMQGYKAPNTIYDESDAVAACEYIVAHGMDISNVESDTNYQIGYGFAKSILEKRRFERIANKYF